MQGSVGLWTSGVTDMMGYSVKGSCKGRCDLLVCQGGVVPGAMAICWVLSVFLGLDRVGGWYW